MVLVNRPGHELWVSEIFGPTVQGEGPSLGRRAMFLRLAGCNLKCVWCDTKYTWDWEHYDRNEPQLMTQMGATEALAKKLVNVHADALPELLVITGGEPLLQRRSLNCLDALYDYKRVEVETNGTVLPEGLAYKGNVWFNVSPKLAHSGNPQSRTEVPKVLRFFAEHERAIFKFVVQSVYDLDEMENWIEYGLHMYDCSRIWVMPEGQDAGKLEQTSRIIADEVIKRGWNLTTRLHTLTWGNERAK